MGWEEKGRKREGLEKGGGGAGWKEGKEREGDGKERAGERKKREGLCGSCLYNLALLDMDIRCFAVWGKGGGGGRVALLSTSATVPSPICLLLPVPLILYRMMEILMFVDGIPTYLFVTVPLPLSLCTG